MPSLPDRTLHSPLEGASFDIRSPRSALIVIMAALAIVAVAAGGFVRGLLSAQPHLAGAAGDITGPVQGAKTAAAMSANPSWSVLNGPQILSPAPPKADDDDSDDDDDDSDTPDEPAVAAAQAPAPAPTPPPAATPAPPTVPPGAAKPAPATPPDLAGVN